MHVWIVEMWDFGKVQWVPTVGTALTYNDGRIARREMEEKNPSDCFRLRRYERSGAASGHEEQP